MILKSIEPLQDLILKPVTDVYWKAENKMQCAFHTDEGTYLSTVLPGFITDLRSGCDLINPIVPRWGNQRYSWAVVTHDGLFCLGTWSFEFSNELCLRQGMAVSGQIGEWRANLAHKMVSTFGRSHFCDSESDLEEPYTLNRLFFKFELVPHL